MRYLGFIYDGSAKKLRRRSSFLRACELYAKFMPNLSAESEPLRRLLNLPDNEFCWGVDQRNAY